MILQKVRLLIISWLNLFFIKFNLPRALFPHKTNIRPECFLDIISINSSVKIFHIDLWLFGLDFSTVKLVFSNNTPSNKNVIIKDDISDPLISDKQMGTFINYNVNFIKIFAIFMSAIILGVVIYITIIKLS